MKTNEDNNDGSKDVSKGWEIVKDLPLVFVPFVDLDLPAFLVKKIEDYTKCKSDRFCWYSFFDNYKAANDRTLYSAEKYDIFPFEMMRRVGHVEIIHQEHGGFQGIFCSWNKSIGVGFLEHKDNYGYFILCK
jgi:hypothetical protein